MRLTRVLTFLPDEAGDFYSLTPHLLMHLDDLAATGVVQPGSRVRYQELWRGEADALAQYRQSITPTLAPNQRLEDAKDGNRQVGSALGRAERYLNLASLAAVLLAGVAVALSAARFAARRFDASALLRCLGMSRRQVMLLFSLQLNDLLLKSMDFSTHSLRAGTFITHSRLELQQHRLLSDNPLLRRPSLLFSRRQFLFFVEQRQQKGKVPAANRLLPDRIQPV